MCLFSLSYVKIYRFLFWFLSWPSYTYETNLQRLTGQFDNVIVASQKIFIFNKSYLRIRAQYIELTALIEVTHVTGAYHL